QDLAGVARLVVQAVDDREADRPVRVAGRRGGELTLGRLADRLAEPPVLVVEPRDDLGQRRPAGPRDRRRVGPPPEHREPAPRLPGLPAERADPEPFGQDVAMAGVPEDRVLESRG